MRVKHLFSIVALLFSAAMAPSLAAGDPLAAPPKGLTPTTTRLADILAAHEKAVGTPPAGTRDSVIESWTFTDSRFDGTEELQRSGTDYHSRIAQGPFVEQYGQLDGKRWHQDANGFTSPTTAVENESFWAVRVLEDAADPKNDVTVLGVTSGAKPAYVLAVKRPGHKYPEWIFYDQASAQIVRVESIASGMRLVQTFDDFRTTDGVTDAWHVHDTDGITELDDDWRLTKIERGAVIPREAFAAPAQQPPDAVSARAPIPSVFLLDGTAIVRVTVGGRGLDFEIDSAQPQSIIDRSVAAELGLPTYGQTTQLPDGRTVGYRTTIADADVGPAHLHDFHVRSESFAYQPRYDTRVVGMLGYDFLANHVVHVDYVNHLVELFPSDSFGADKPVDGGIELPLTIDDGLPLVPMEFGDALTSHVVLGSTMPFSVVFGPFYDGHQDQFKTIGRHQENAVPFADGNTVGQHLDVWPAQSTALQFAIANFGPHPFLATTFTFENAQQIDAIVGNDYLAYFDLYYDFPHGRFFVKPNEWFYKTFVKAT